MACGLRHLLAVALFLASLHAQTDMLHPKVLGLAHVAFRTSDLDRTQLFYQSQLGYQEPFSLGDASGNTSTAFVKVNDLQYVELFQSDANTAGQLDHLALYTSDLTAMRARLQSLGMYIAKDIHRGRLGNPFLTIRDPDGHFIEILQYSSGSLTGQSQGKFMPATRISDHISHVGIIVSSIDTSMKFYRDALGFREFARGETRGGQPSWIDLQTPNGEDYIELIPVSGKHSPVELKAQEHLGLETSDIRKAVATLKERVPGSSPIASIGVETDRGLPPRVNFVDPDGARVEITEPVSAGNSLAGSPAARLGTDVSNY